VRVSQNHVGDLYRAGHRYRPLGEFECADRPWERPSKRPRALVGSSGIMAVLVPNAIRLASRQSRPVVPRGLPARNGRARACPRVTAETSRSGPDVRT